MRKREVQKMRSVCAFSAPPPPPPKVWMTDFPCTGLHRDRARCRRRRSTRPGQPLAGRRTRRRRRRRRRRTRLPGWRRRSRTRTRPQGEGGSPGRAGPDDPTATWRSPGRRWCRTPGSRYMIKNILRTTLEAKKSCSTPPCTSARRAPTTPRLAEPRTRRTRWTIFALTMWETQCRVSVAPGRWISVD